MDMVWLRRVLKPVSGGPNSTLGPRSRPHGKASSGDMQSLRTEQLQGLLQPEVTQLLLLP